MGLFAQARLTAADLQGTVQLDRMHVELSYPPPPPARTRVVKK